MKKNFFAFMILVFLVALIVNLALTKVWNPVDALWVMVNVLAYKVFGEEKKK